MRSIYSSISIPVFFISETTGWAVGGGPYGAGSKISKTVDGGNSWTHRDIAIDALFSIFFSSDSIGWTVGTEGTILKTTDSGNSWGTQISGSNMWLTSAICSYCNLTPEQVRIIRKNYTELRKKFL